MTRMTEQLIGPVALLLAVGGWSTPVAAQVKAQHGAGDEWKFYGGDAGSTRYSPLDQIDESNVADLQVAWRWTTANVGPRPEPYPRVTPIMIDGVLYVTAGYRRAAVAIDAATGETLWIYRFEEGERGENTPWANSGRGLAYWTDGGDARVFLITPGFHLIALNARTGRPYPDFGTDGIVDLKDGLDPPVDLIDGRIGSSSPPLVVNDVVVIGAALHGGGASSTQEMPPGHIGGYDPRTGERLWIFHTVPQPGEFGHDTWEQDSWRSAGNASVWAPMSADEELGYVYASVGSATGEYYGGRRHGDNLFSQSLVCLDAKTGERVWHFQFVHHGIWDYDPPAAPIVFDLELHADGRPNEVVVQVTKQAFVYLLDRLTGEPSWPIAERAVPQTDLPGEHTSPTQPFPTFIPPFDRQGITLDDLIDFTPELRAEAVKVVSQYRLGPLFTPPSAAEAPDGTKGTIQLPGSLGGANWMGGSVDPEPGILYVGSVTVPSLLALGRDPERSDGQDVSVRGSVPRPFGLPLVKPPWGRVTATDLNAGSTRVWMVPTGDTPDEVRDHPALQGVDLPQTGEPIQAATLVTRRLLFVTGGWRLAGDPVLRAHDKKTGALVAEIELPGRPSAAPMTYQVGDTQYVVVMVGSPGQPAELVALTLP